MTRAPFFLIALCLIVSPVFAAGAAYSDKGKSESQTIPKTGSESKKIKTEGTDASSAQPAKKKAEDMTVQELAESLSWTLDESDEVMNFIPGFKKEADPEGREFYTHNGKKLENLEIENLRALYTRVLQERARLNMERITKQMESVRQAQHAANIANQATRIPKLTQTPPQPPKTPPAPPSTPRR